MHVIAVANQKGGVGKTTTAFALGAALTERGQRVLLVDFDPQGSLTAAAGLGAGDLNENVATFLTRYLAHRDRPVDLGSYTKTLAPSLDILPTTIDLAETEHKLQRVAQGGKVLASALKASNANDLYDALVVDCSPSLSQLTVDALTAATDVVIPMPPEFLAIHGLTLLLNTIRKVQVDGANPHLRIAGIVLTMADPRTKMGREIAQTIYDQVGTMIPVLGTVKRSIKVQEATTKNHAITTFSPRSDAAQAYVSVADALLAQWAVAANA